MGNTLRVVRKTDKKQEKTTPARPFLADKTKLLLQVYYCVNHCEASADAEKRPFDGVCVRRCSATIKRNGQKR